MRYDDFRRSDDIEDRRDEGGGGLGGGGGGFGLPMGGGGLGIGTIIVLGLIGYAFGIDPRILIGGAEIITGGGQAPTYQTDRQSQASAKRGAPTDEMGSMIAGILGEIDDRWSEIFQAAGKTYTGPRIVLFRNQTNGGRPAEGVYKFGGATVYAFPIEAVQAFKGTAQSIDVPKPLATATTNEDGTFTITVPPGVPHFLFCEAQRPVPNGTENCAWAALPKDLQNRTDVQMTTRNRVVYRQLHIAQ